MVRSRDEAPSRRQADFKVSGTFAELWAGLAIFFVSHSLPSVRGARSSLVSILGDRGFFLVYSVISLAVTTWLIIAALRAPAVELWPGPHALAGHAVMAFRDRFSRLRHLADGP